MVEVADRLEPPIRRVVLHWAPTCGLPAWPMCPSTTPFCHWLNRVGSVAYSKTSAAGRSISVLVVIGGFATRRR